MSDTRSMICLTFSLPPRVSKDCQSFHKIWMVNEIHNQLSGVFRRVHPSKIRIPQRSILLTKQINFVSRASNSSYYLSYLPKYRLSAIYIAISYAYRLQLACRPTSMKYRTSIISAFR